MGEDGPRGVSPKNINPYPSEYSEMNSPLLTSPNEKRRLDKVLHKDSCATFHMGKENLMTGKTE